MNHPAETAVTGMEKPAWIGTALTVGMMAMPFITSLIEKLRGGGAAAQQAGQGMMQRFNMPQTGHGMASQLGHAGTHYAAHKAPGYAKPMLTSTAQKLHRFRGF